ncbi:MAG: putative DNA binding domain-containing protein [Deltaproteobacteria bacterium]|nr:putative DNA binding domain-containing protein [Deltaproteobacteria bacterium]
MSDDDIINQLLKVKEGENCQFKEAKTKFGINEAAKCLCALSNSGGGKLVLGITDKRPRTVVGTNSFTQPERTREQLSQMLNLKIEFDIFFTSDEKCVLIFHAPGRPIGLPVALNDIRYEYSGDSLLIMSQDKVKSIYNESVYDFSGDICNGLKLTDLDMDSINIFREKWASHTKNNNIRELSDEQLLRDCRAMDDSGIKYAALILFGKDTAINKFLSHSEICYEYRVSEAAGPADYRKDFKVCFFSCFDDIWKLINSRNTKQHYQTGLFMEYIETFNERVIREILLNAVTHRNYQLPGMIFIRQYPDKITVISPGGLPYGVTIDNILQTQNSRNNTIAEMFQHCGLVERSGQGMDIIYRTNTLEAKELPDFTGTDEYSVQITLDGKLVDPHLLKVVSDIGKDRIQSFNTTDFLIIRSLFFNQKVHAKLNNRLKHLENIGIIEKIKHGKYILARRIYQATGKLGEHTRLLGLGTETNKELILKHTKSTGETGAHFKEFAQLLPSHSRKQIHVLLKKLRGENKIELHGKKSKATWHIKKHEL